MDYCNEAGETNDPNGETSSSAFSVNQLHFEGVSFHSDEFPAEARSFSRSLIIDNNVGFNHYNNLLCLIVHIR